MIQYSDALLACLLRTLRVRITHLETDDVGRVVSDFLDDALLAVIPVERPRRTVAIHLACAVLVTQDIVAHHGENGCNSNKRPDQFLLHGRGTGRSIISNNDI